MLPVERKVSIRSLVAICFVLVISSSHQVASFSNRCISALNLKESLQSFRYSPFEKDVNTFVIKSSRALSTSLKTDLNDDNNVDDQIEISDESIPTTDVKVRMDDGGSNLTNRFKFKVNALMGTFDPEEGTPDDDKQVGNIFNVMMYYPNEFSFTLVYKFSNPDNDDEETQKLVNNVKDIAASVLLSSSTNKNKDSLISNMEVITIPRGKKFVKISLKTMVNSGDDISMIYESLSDVENIVMKF